MNYKNTKLNCFCGCVWCSIPRLFVYLRMRMFTSKQYCGSAFELGCLRVSPVLRLQGARRGNGVRGHRLSPPPCFVQNLIMYFGFLSRWERLLANICSVYSYTWILVYFTFISFCLFSCKHISNIWFYMLNVIIGRHTWNCQIRTRIYTKIQTHRHAQTKKKKVERVQ